LDSFDNFLQDLERFEWSPAGHIDPGILELLSEIGRNPELVGDAVTSWRANNLDKRQLYCHETTTHYKWFVHYHDELRYKIWLHQYKLRSERNFGYAEVPHNHRYSLASVILRGGFIHHLFARTENGLDELVRERRSFSRGDAYAVDWRRPHKLSGLDDHTVTLVVETPAVRHFSEAFYEKSGKPSLFYDFIELHARLSAELTSREDAETPASSLS
jgi:hypothetical protein